MELKGVSCYTFCVWILLKYHLILTAEGRREGHRIANSFTQRYPSYSLETCGATCTHQILGSAKCSMENVCIEQNQHQQNKKCAYPSQPEMVNAQRILFGGMVGHKLSFIPPQDGTNDDLEAMEIVSRKIGNPKEKICTVYTFDGIVTARSQFVKCFQGSFYHEIRNFPQRRGANDYVHLIVSVFDAKHNSTNTVNWSPGVITIHNDSCSNSVEVTFELAPVDYNFKEYRVRLHSVPSDSSKDENKDIHPDETQTEAKVTFERVKDGQYEIEIYHKASSKCECRQDGECEVCAYSTSKQFFMNSLHEKCHPEPVHSQDTDENCQPTTQCNFSQDKLLIICGVVFLVAALFVIVMSITVCLRHKKAKDQKRARDEADNLNNETVLSRTNEAERLVSDTERGGGQVDESINGADMRSETLPLRDGGAGNSPTDNSQLPNLSIFNIDESHIGHSNDDGASPRE